MDCTVRSGGYGKAGWKASEVLARSLRARDHNAKECYSACPQGLAGRSQLANVATTEWAVHASEHRQEDWAASEVFSECDSAVSLGGREGKVWCPIAWSEHRAQGISHRYCET